MSDSPISGTWGSSITGTWTIAADTIDTVIYVGAVFGAGGGEAAVLQGPGTLDSSGNATVNQYNGATTQLTLTGGVTWQNAGTITQNGGLQFGATAGDSATLVNDAGAIYYLNAGNAQVTTGGAGSYAFINAGLLQMINGGVDTLGVPLNNSGTVASTNGALYLSGPVANSGTLVANGGFLEIQGGTLGGTIEALSNNAALVGTYSVAANTIDTVTFESAYLGWGGDGQAVFAGPGTVVSNGFVYVRQYNGNATQLQLTNGVTWYNAGYVQQEGGVEFGGSTTDTATIVNQAGATYLLNGGNAQITDDAGGTYNFINDGLLEMNAGGTDNIAVPLDNSGTVESTNGALYLFGPVTNSGTLLADGGFLEDRGGTLGGTIEAVSNNLGLVGTYSVAAGTVDTVTFSSAYLGWGGDGAAVFSGPGTMLSNGFVYVDQYNGAATQLQLIDGVTWDNAGTVQQEGAVEFGGSTIDTATIVNQAGATYLLDGGNAQITDDAGGTYDFVNAGLLEMYAGGDDTLSVPLDNTGTVASTNGGFYLAGPVTNSGTLLANGGFLEVKGGTLGGTIEALSNSVGLIGTYAVAAGTTDTVTFSGVNLGWYSDGYAVFAGPGTLVSNGNASISAYNYASVQLQLIDGITWDNAGTVNQYGGLVFGESSSDTATLVNQAGATYVLNAGNAQISDTAGGTYSFINAGTLKMVGGGGDTISVPLINTGLVTSTNGDMAVAGGFVNSGTMLANGGELDLEGGTLGGTIGVGPNGSNVYLTGTYAVAGGVTDTVTLAGATFGHGGGAGIAYFSGAGTVATDGSATINDYYYYYPNLVLENGITWDNFGSINQLGGLQFGNAAGDSATVVNEAGATWTLNGGNAYFVLGGTTGTYSFINDGLLQMVSGGGDYLSVPLDNAGVISADNGEIYIDGPLTNSGTILTGGGSVQINGGTLGGTLNAANGAIWLLGTYALAGGTTDTVTLGSATFGDGGDSSIAYLSGSGTLVTEGSAIINNYYYYYPDLILENGATWENFGAINQEGGLQLGNAAGDNATVINEAGATWTLNAGNAYLEQGGTAGTYNFINNGLMQMVNGGGEHIQVPLDNAGVISSDNGEIFIDGPLTNTGTILTAGGSVQIDGGGSIGGTLDAANGAIWVMGTYTTSFGVTDTASFTSVTFGNGSGASIAYLSGPGTLAASGSASITNYYYSDPDLVLTGGITWNNSGDLYVNGGLQFGNYTGDSATLDMEAGSVLDLDNGNSALETFDSGTFGLVESGLLEMTAGGNNSIGVAVDETSTGTISANNGNLYFDDGATISGLVNGGAEVVFDGGNVTVTATGDITTNTVDIAAGDVYMQGGTINSANLTVAGGVEVIGYGALGDASIGALVDASGGLLTVNGAISGVASFEIETGATLEFTGSNSRPVTFDGTDATLKLDSESSFSGTIANFAGGDTIDLAGITLSAVSYVGGDLIGTLAAGGTISLSAPGVDAGLQLELGTDSNGASTIYLQPSPVSAVPDLLTALGPNNSLVLPDAHVFVPIAADPTLEIENAATAPADGLDVSVVQTTGSAYATGQIISLAPGAIDDSSINVGLNDQTAGTESGTVSLDYASDGTVSGVETDLGTQTLNLSGNVYRLASPVISAPTNVYLHVGDGSGNYDENLTIANVDPADGYSEGLDAAAITGVGGNVLSANGTTADIAAGGSDDSSITVEIPTGTAGTVNGYADLALSSDGTGVDTLGLTALEGGSVNSALGDFSLASNANGVWSYLNNGTLLADTSSSSTVETWTNGGSDPNGAFVSLNPTDTTQTYSGTVVLPPTYLDLDPQGTGNVAVEFTAAGDGVYTLSGSVLGTDTGEQAHEVALEVNGSIVASTTLSAFQQIIPIDETVTLTAGDTVEFVAFSGPGDQPHNLGTGLSLTVTEDDEDFVPVSATIDNYATAAIQQAGGAGSLSAIGNTYTLDFGTVAAAPGDIAGTIDVANIATGQADWLSGSLSAVVGAGFSDTGLGSIGTVAAGDSTPLIVDLPTGTAGTFSQTITLTADSTNPDGSTALNNEMIVVTGTVLSSAALAQAVINEPSPIVLPDAHLASLVPNDQIALDIGNTGSDTLSGFVSSASGAAYGSGTITALAPGLTDTTDIVAGLNNTQAGSLSGTVNLSFGSGIDDVALSPQTVSLEGGVYRLAAPSITGPANTIVHVGDGVGDTDSEALVISNTATPDGYSENLDATALSVASGNLTAAGGTASEIAAGASNTTAATFSFSTATAGTEAGSITVAEISDGSTIDTLGTTMLGTVDVPVNVTVNNYATAAIQQAGGSGELVQTGSIYTLNLGTFAQGVANPGAQLDVANTAAGPADLLSGSLSSNGGSAFAAYYGTGSVLSVTYFEVSDTGNAPDFSGGGTPNVAIGSTLGPDGLPVASSPAGVADVNSTTNEITWWDPSLNSGVVETGTGFDSLPYASNMYAPDSTGSNDGTYYETAILQGTFSLSAEQSVTFQVGSDDDTFIYVDGTLIGSNPGIHGNETQDFTAANLAAGSHTVEIFYDDRDTSGANLNVSVVTPGVTITPANTGGLGAFGGVAAGGNAPFSVDLSTANAGVFTETITLAETGSNASGYSAALPGETLEVTGTVLPTASLANPVINNGTTIALADAHVASPENDQAYLDISNTGSDVLSGYVAGASGAAYGNGAFLQLPPGDSDSSDIAVGLNNTSDGVKSGSVTLGFTSGGDNLITDGSFEDSGSFAGDGNNTMLVSQSSTIMPGWTVTAGNPLAWDGPGGAFGITAEDGRFYLDLTGYADSEPFSGVTQTIATTVGDQYQLSFELGSSSNYGLPASITATAGSTSETFTSTGTGSDNWQLETLDFTATGTTTAITLAGSGGHAYIGLDDVSVTPVGAPQAVALDPQTVAVTGTVYNYGTASVSLPSTVYLHAGDDGGSATETLNVANTASTDGYSECVDVAGVGGLGDVTGTSGSSGDIAAGQSADAVLTVNVSTATAANGGTAVVSETSDGTNVDTLGTTNLGTVDVPINIIVDNYASSAMEQTGGNGSMVPNGTEADTYILNLGATEQYANPLTADLAEINAAAGPAADQLDGSYTISGDSQYSDTGFGAFSGINYGNAEGGNTVELNTGTIGVFTQQITLSPTGTNASGYSGTLAAETIDVVGTIVPVPPPPPPPLATATAWGDVHLTTFDGLYYNFQAEGEFVLAQSAVPGDTFAVQARMEPYSANSTVSVMTMIGADVGGQQITFGLGRDDVVAIGGVGQTFAGNGSSIALAGGGSVTQLTSSTYQLNWGTGEVMTVTDAGSYFNLNLTLSAADGPGSVQGLLGSDTGQANDFQLADGTVLAQPLTSAELYGAFADAWRVTSGIGGNSLMDYLAGQSTATFTDDNFPADAVNVDNLPAAILQQAELEVQQAGITDPNQQAAAVLDLLVTGNPNALQDDVDVGQNGETTTAAEITVPPPPVPALGVSAVATNVVETAGGTTDVTFNAYLTNASGTDTVIDWAVTSPNATYLAASSLGSNATSGFVIIPAGQTTGQFTVTLPAGVLGTDPSANLQVSISSTNGDPVFGQTAQTEIDNYQPVAGNAAIPVLTLASGSGTFSGSDGNYTLNLGTLVAGEAPLQDRFQIANDALAPSDLLAGSITASGSNFTVYGATQVSPLGAGTSYLGLVTEANTSQTGAQSETIVLNPVDENITGYSSIQASQTVTISDTVLADAVGDLVTSGPINLGTFYQGQPAQIGLDIENAAGAGAAALDVTASSSGQATATGAITELGAGDTDGSSIQAGIDTSSPGIKTGYVTLDYASDAGGGNTAGAGSQQIEVIGTVYGPATASLSAPIVYVHKGDDGGSVTVPIIISNTGTNNGFTESLSAKIISFGTYVTAASGSFVDLAPGISNNTSLAATLSDANYGTFAGEVAVELQSDGTGIDSSGTTSLGIGYVQAAIDVNQYAVAAMQEISGNGTMVPTGVATKYSLDLGTVAQYATPLGANLAVLNDVLGQADLLAGSFSISGAPEFTNAGFGAFGPGTEIAGLAAQQEDTDPVVVLSSATVGVFTETLTLNASGYNPDDPSGYALTPETVTITGTVVAAPAPTPAARVSDAWGDVHLTTFDGLYYNFMAAGEFVLSESTIPGDTFEIQARMQPWNGSSSVSVNTMVAAQVGSDRVTFGIDRTDVVWIDGQGVSLSSNPVVTLADGTLEQTSADTWRLVWNTGEELDITDAGSYLNATVSLPNSDAGNVQGLLGNDGGNPADDLTLPGGAPIASGGSISYAQLYGTYEASWQVTDSTSLMDYQTGQEAASFSNPNFPYNQILLGNLPPNAYQEALAAAQAAGITDPNLLQAAIVDYLFTGNPQALQASENVQQQEGTGASSGQTVTAPPAPVADVGVLANLPTVVELAGTAEAVGFTAYLTSPEATNTLIEYSVNGNAGPGFLNASDFPGDILPNGTVTIAAGQTTAEFTVAIPAGVLGSEPDENLQVVITPQNPEQSVFAPEAQTEILNTGPTPGNPATPLVELLSGDGALTGSGTSYELNLGSVEQYSDPLVAGYGVENDGIIPADLLSGSFLDAGSSQFLNSGLSPFAPIATGNADSAPEVELLTNQVGTFTENVTLTPTDSNLTNYSSIMPLVTIEVVGTITAPPPPPPPPVPEATAWGDVHLTTFDGVYYNFQAAGEYVLTRSTVAGDTFQVQARLEPYGANSSVTVQTQVGAAIGTDDVVFALTGTGYNEAPFYLDGTAEALGIGQTLTLSDGAVTETSANTYRVNWDTGESMTVTLNGSYISDTIELAAADAGKVQGLLGPDDGNPSTDLQLPDGQSIASNGTIASSVLYGVYESGWQVQSSPQSLLYYGTGQTFDGFNIPGFPEDALTLSQLPANLVAAAEAIVEAEGITNPNLVDAAVIDLLVTGDPNSVFSTANVQEEGVLLNSAAVSIPTPLPSVGILADSTTVLEPTSGTLAVDYTVYLTAAAAQTSTVDYSVTGSGPNNLGTADIVGGTGSGVVQIAAGQTSVQIVVDVLANALGSQPDAELQVSVTATGGESVFGGSAETEIVNPTPTAGNPAEALIEQLAGNGHLSGGGTDYVLNLGTQVQNGSDLYANVGIENGATVPADDLSGQFTITDYTNFLNTGFVPFSNVAPGAADTEPAIELGTGTIGVYTETIVLDPTDTNSSGYSQPQNDVTLTVTGTIVPMPLAPPPSMPTATAWGDVHLTTFDGLYYNFQAVGEFTLARSTVAGDSFNVQIRTTQYDGSSVSVIDQVAVGIGSGAVTFGTSTSQPATVLLNGGAANFVNGVLTLTDGTVTEESPSSYVVNWNTGESLTVNVSGSYINTTVALATQDENGHVEGLLGYDNGVNNDFAPIVSGTTITTTQLYYGSGDPGVADSLADYWRVAQANSLLYYAPGTTTSDYTNNGFPADALSLQSLPTALQQEGLQEAVQAGITDPQLQQAAALDYIVTGDPDIVIGGANVQQQGITTTDSDVTGAAVTPALGVSANDAALVEPASGNLNVGFTVYLTEAEAQATTVDWTVEAPNSGYLNASDFAGDVLPSGSVIIAAGSTSANFSVEVNAGVLADLPSNDLQVVITPTGTEAVFAPSAQTTIVNNQVEPGTPSSPVIALLSGEGTLTQISNDYTLELGSVPLGGTVEALSLAIENAAAVGSDGLAGSLAATSIPGFTVSGTGPLPVIAAGDSYQGLHVAVNTGEAGDFSETITFTPEDQNASGYSAADAPITLTIDDTVSSIYASASPVTPNPMNFGIVHVGASATQALSVTNTAPTGGSPENVDGSIGSATGDAITNGGSFSGLAAGLTNSGSLVVGLSTATDGVESGSAIVTLESDGTGIDSNGITPLPSQTIDVYGTVNNYATASISEISGAGTLAQGGDAYTINLGTLTAGSLPVAIGLGISNTATGLADALSGSFAITNSSGAFINNADSAFAGIVAGQLDVGPTVTLTAGTNGAFSETITLFGTGSNADYNGTLTPETVTIVGSVTQFITLTTGADIVNGANNVTIVAATNTLSGGDKINGGSGTNTLELVGGGSFNLASPTSLTNIQVVDATEGQGAAEQTIFLRNGTDLTLNLASAATNPSSAGAVVHGANNDDTINLGAGNDAVQLGGTGETVNGGSGFDIFYVTDVTIGGTIVAGSGTNLLEVQGGGTAVMGANITGIQDVFLLNAGTSYNFTANATSGLAIHASADSDTITVGSASQSVYASSGPLHILATAADAGVAVRGANGNTTLEVTTGGTITPNSADWGVTLLLDAASTVFLPASEIAIDGSAGNDVFVATSNLRGDLLLNGGSGTNTLELVGGGSFNLATPITLTNIQVVDATEGQGAAEQTIFLRNGTDLTLNLASAATNPSSAGAVVHGANNDDTINLGAGNDAVQLGGSGETVNGGSGFDIFYVTDVTIGGTIVGGGGTNWLEVQGGGTAVMGANITGIQNVFLLNAGTSYNFTANATSGLAIHASADSDTITVGSASQSVYTSSGALRILATAANAGVVVRGANGNTTLEITTGGTITPNSADWGVTLLLDAASTVVLPGCEIAIDGSAGNDVFVATSNLRGDLQLNGGGGTNTLELVGGGNFNLAAPETFANIQVVDATEGQTGARPSIYLRNGTTLTVNLASAATNPQSAGAVIYGANNHDTINLGAGLDTVVIGGAGETVNGGSGNELFDVTAATIGATIAAGSGTNTMDVAGGGTVVMGASVTGIHSVFLETAGTSYDFTANATQGMVIHASAANDTIVAGSASQTVAGSTGNLLVQATAANAGVYVRDGSGSNQLDITTGGAAALNSGDNNLTVLLNAASTTLTLNHMEFIHAEGSAGSDVIIAGAAGQVLTGGGAGDTLEDAGHYGVTFQDTIAGIAGDTLADFSRVDTIDLTNLSVGSVTGTPQYTGGYGAASSGVLAVTTGSGTIDINMSGLAAGGVFSAATDNHGGTVISYS